MWDRFGYPLCFNLFTDDDSPAAKWLRLMIRNGTLTLNQNLVRPRIELTAFWDVPV